ncbi:hypothetical protein [Ottowia sp.]|uniref:hypothetical protein n=1 Tax=Ottowia sp. TaxID=1898956 RepID=UPI003A87B1C0
MDKSIIQLHSYRATMVPVDTPAADVEAAADAGHLPTIQLLAPNAAKAASDAKLVTGRAVLRVERVEPPATVHHFGAAANDDAAEPAMA